MIEINRRNLSELDSREMLETFMHKIVNKEMDQVNERYIIHANVS